MPFPSPTVTHPVILPDGTVHRETVFLRAILDHPGLKVGDYTYASAHREPGDWAAALAPYLYPSSPERLEIGNFCQIAHGVQFITDSANHRRDGFSTYPFAIFDGREAGRPSLPDPAQAVDTVVGHDVWFGTGALVLPGARIGSGVIVGAGAVVGGHVPDYAVVAGNPARIVRLRRDAETISALLDLAWWDWPIDTILAAEAAICGADLAALQAVRG